MEKGTAFRIRLLLTLFLFCMLNLAGSRPVKAAKYVDQANTTVSITSNTTGWVQINGSWYYYDKNGKMRWGSIKYKKQYYYCASNGVRVTGFVKRGGALYYYSKNTGRMLHGRWLVKSGKKYYLSSSGKALTGEWLSKSGKKYYFDNNSQMVTGLTKISGKLYYFNSGGAMRVSKWYTDSSTGNRYYFSKTGRAATSKWLSKSGKKYYFDENSVAVTGWYEIDGYYYYFNKKGVMQKNKWVGMYYVDANGRRTDQTKEGVTTSNEDKSKYTYTSSTLNITLQKKTKHSTSYWVAEIKTSDASTQLKSALSHDSYGGTLQTTSSAVASHNGIIGINGSGFDSSGKPRADSMCIKNGVVYSDKSTGYNVMCVTSDGTMFAAEQGLMAADLLALNVKDTYVFGPVLISDGVAQGRLDDSYDEVLKYYPRTAVGMVSQNHYVIVVTNTGSYNGLNGSDLVSIFQSYGCQFAYNLDGGGSSTLYFDGQVMNALLSEGERACADFLYFTN